MLYALLAALEFARFSGRRTLPEREEQSLFVILGAKRAGRTVAERAGPVNTALAKAQLGE